MNRKSENQQKAHWEEIFSNNQAFFGEEPSEFARTSCNLFRRKKVQNVLELGCGQGRDTLFFARNGLKMTALDYAETAVETLKKGAAAVGVSPSVLARPHDVRQPLPFPDASFDACYSHMLLCMELSTAEIRLILDEIRRVLRPAGIVRYSVRSSFDKHYRTGTHLREGIYEIGGFAVHFFTEEKIRKLAKGYQSLKIDRMQEGSLPRDLFCVTLEHITT